VIALGYSLSHRFPDPPQTDYRAADVRALRHDLFCGDVYLAEGGNELSTAWGWVPVLDFAWALCDITERLDQDPLGSRAARPQRAVLDFTQSTEALRFERRFGWVDITADWDRPSPAPGLRSGNPPCAKGHEPGEPEPRARSRGDGRRSADPGARPLTVNHGALRCEARDFLHDLVADLVDMHDELGGNPVVRNLLYRFPRV
jgi:hypothetical protein